MFFHMKKQKFSLHILSFGMDHLRINSVYSVLRVRLLSLINLSNRAISFPSRCSSSVLEHSLSEATHIPVLGSSVNMDSVDPS